MKILVIIPAYNESAVIAKTVREVREKAPMADILAVNDGSSDNTLEILRREGVDHLNLRCNLGIGGAVQSGYVYALENGYDYAVQIDGDGQHDPAYIMPIIEQMKKDGANVGIGSRFIDGKGFQSSGLRRFGIRFLSRLIRLACGVRVLDVTSGLRVADRSCIELYARDYSDDYPEPEAIVAATAHGAKIVEYPVIMRSRSTGTSSISAVKSVYYMIKVSLAIIMYKTILRKRFGK